MIIENKMFWLLQSVEFELANEEHLCILSVSHLAKRYNHHVLLFHFNFANEFHWRNVYPRIAGTCSQLTFIVEIRKGPEYFMKICEKL